jgi:hypothetical protein
MIEVAFLNDKGKAQTIGEFEREDLPTRLQPHVGPDTLRILKLKEETDAGVTTQLWSRWDAISPKHVRGHRFTVRFDAP